MNKLIIGVLILGSMLTVSGCASKSSDVASNNAQIEQYQIKDDSSNSNINDNANNSTTDNEKQNNKADTSKSDDSEKNNSKSDNSKSNDSKDNIEKDQPKNNSNDKKSQDDSSINNKNKTDNCEDNTTTSNSAKKETISNNDINEEKSTDDTSSKKSYTNSSKNTDSISSSSTTSNSNTSNLSNDKKTTVKPTTKATKEQAEIAKKNSTPSKNKVVKDRVTQNNKQSSTDDMQDYYGTWVISEVIGYTRISTNNTSPLNKTLVLGKNSYTNNSFNFTIENPKYLITNISKTSFCNGYKLNSLQGTGLSGDTITALDINSSTNPNSDFDELYIQNGYLVYLQDGVFFKCVKQ